MRIAGYLLCAAAGLAMIQPAAAAVIVDETTDKVTLSGSGGTFTVNFGSLVEGVSDPDVNSNIVFTLGSVAADGLSATLSYLITNTSTDPSRLSVFGFRVNGGATLRTTNPITTSTGRFDEVLIGSHNLPQLQGRPINICFKEQGNGNCNNGQLGVTQGTNSGTGTINLRFLNAVNDFTIDNFAVRYQSLGPRGQGSGVGTGEVVAPIPEPATWTMMLAGFGLVGGALRRRNVQLRFA